MLEKIGDIEVPGLQYKVKALRFADDTFISADTIEEMKENMHTVENWCDMNCMKINAAKFNK